MVFFSHLRQRNWPTVLGYLLFIGMMTMGYYYNVTFIQLGLIDLGERRLGLSEAAVAAYMAALALVTCVIALATGFLLQRRPLLRTLRTRLRLVFAVVLVQTALTAMATLVNNQLLFLLWIIVASAALGVGMPVTFSLTVDLIPVRDRGYVAALITALAYFAAAAIPSDWRIEQFQVQLLLPMLGGALTMAALAFGRFPFIDRWSQQQQQPAFAYGRFVKVAPGAKTRVSRRLIVLIALMFGIFFIDSLGFLRIIHTPVLVESTWRAQELAPHLVIAITHVVAALIAGVLYTALDERHLFLWIFGIFALVHFMYTFPFRFGSGGQLAPAILYAIAVSLYTVVNFAIWADISTPDTIYRNAAVGVALSGWTATFISTALATYWRVSGLSVGQHLRWVNAIAILFFLALLSLPFLPSLPRAGDRPRQQDPLRVKMGPEEE